MDLDFLLLEIKAGAVHGRKEMGDDRKRNKQILCGQVDNRRRTNNKRGSEDIIPIGEASLQTKEENQRQRSCGCNPWKSRQTTLYK